MFGDSSFFTDSPGSATAHMASAIDEGIDAIIGKMLGPLSRESSGNLQSKAEKAGLSTNWPLLPFKRTNELQRLEAKLQGRIHILAESHEWLESNAGGGILHRHVSAPPNARTPYACSLYHALRDAMMTQSVWMTDRPNGQALDYRRAQSRAQCSARICVLKFKGPAGSSKCMSRCPLCFDL